ncbi:MAG TPA: acyl carrier protein [Desulfomicrobiaceae bacterium]|nr:acyl carrier protein [Desulfomicrobiaceae bacterium]
MKTLESIVSFIEENFLFGDKIHVSQEQSLTKNNVIDSTGILEIISFIEHSYNISVHDEDIVPENFDSIQSITQYINTKKTE